MTTNRVSGDCMFTQTFCRCSRLQRSSESPVTSRTGACKAKRGPSCTQPAVLVYNTVHCIITQYIAYSKLEAGHYAAVDMLQKCMTERMQGMSRTQQVWGCEQMRRLTESAGPGVESRLRRLFPGGIGSASCMAQ